MSATKGNDPERWQKLLDVLDDKLQLALLERLRKVVTYHFEEDILYIEPASKEEAEQLTKDTVFHQLELFAQDSIKVDKVKIRKAS
jgi:fructose-1,6-bisphosphatase